MSIGHSVRSTFSFGSKCGVEQEVSRVLSKVESMPDYVRGSYFLGFGQTPLASEVRFSSRYFHPPFLSLGTVKR
ncbi:hypothetical protein GN956_G22760 [Arapaima gigas]